MIGIGIISLDSAGEPEMAGVALALMSVLLFAGYMINLQHTRNISPVYLTWINNLICACVLFAAVREHLALTVSQTILLAVMGAVQLGAPYFLFSKGLQTVSLPEAALIALIEPVLNPLWVALIVGELPSRATIWGGVMILCGLGVRYVWPLTASHTEAADTTDSTN
jgi:drug/metabolite transporter (DMT)-like permease